MSRPRADSLQSQRCNLSFETPVYPLNGRCAEVDVTPELVRAAQQGDPAAMEDLISGSYRAAYTLALRLLGNPDDAAEATQEAYIRMVKGLKRFREVGAFPTWLFKIVSNVCMTEMRKRSRRDLPVEMETMGGTERLPWTNEPAAVDAESEAIGRVFWGELEAAVQELPEAYRSVVVLRDVYGLSGEETGEILGVSSGAVKVRLHRARRRLRDRLATQFPEWVIGEEGERETT
jgi:RNA polymerase sigma-70 factor (ECF subfamily)